MKRALNNEQITINVSLIKLNPQDFLRFKLFPNSSNIAVDIICTLTLIQIDLLLSQDHHVYKKILRNDTQLFAL